MTVLCIEQIEDLFEDEIGLQRLTRDHADPRRHKRKSKCGAKTSEVTKQTIEDTSNWPVLTEKYVVFNCIATFIVR